MRVGDEVWVWYVERLWELALDLPVEEIPSACCASRKRRSRMNGTRRSKATEGIPW
jgi:hypothetical protein